MFAWTPIIVVLAGLGVATPAAEDTFPTFEPFVASRMWGPGFGQPGVHRPAAETAALIESFVVELSVPSPLPPAPPRRADLDPTIDPDLRTAWAFVPWCVLQLEPLWDRTVWSDDDVRLAGAVARFLTQVDPELDEAFEVGSDMRNRAAVRRLGAWFDAKVRDPQRYGYMIFTFDSGPWAALEPGSGARVTGVEDVPVDDTFRLRLCRTDDEQWCLQGIEGKQPVWTRVLTEVPQPGLTFVKDPVLPLGRHGYKVGLSFGEYVHLYLDAAKQPLFYFVSW